MTNLFRVLLGKALTQEEPSSRQALPQACPCPGRPSPRQALTQTGPSLRKALVLEGPCPGRPSFMHSLAQAGPSPRKALAQAGSRPGRPLPKQALDDEIWTIFYRTGYCDKGRH